MQFYGIRDKRRDEIIALQKIVFKDGSFPLQNIFCQEVVINAGYPAKYSRSKDARFKFYQEFSKLEFVGQSEFYACERYLFEEQVSSIGVGRGCEIDGDLIDELYERFEENAHDGVIYPSSALWGICFDHLVGFIWIGMSCRDAIMLKEKGLLCEGLFREDFRDADGVLPEHLCHPIVDVSYW
jgi:hypothetical protein